MKKITIFLSSLLLCNNPLTQCSEFLGIAAGQALLGASTVALSNHIVGKQGAPLLTVNETISSKAALAILATAGGAIFIKDLVDSYDDTKREITSMPLTDTQQAALQFVLTSVNFGTGYFVLINACNENISLPMTATCCLTGYALIRGAEEAYYTFFATRPKGLRKRREA